MQDRLSECGEGTPDLRKAVDLERRTETLKQGVILEDKSEVDQERPFGYE
jgi:hypothetical protein